MAGMTRLFGMALLAGVMFTQLGCTTALKQVYYEVRGAKAELMFNDAPATAELKTFQKVRFEPPTTDLAPELVPPDLLDAYHHQLRQSLLDLHDDYPGGAPVLRVDSEVLYFQEKGILSPAMMITRVWLRGEGRVVGDLLVRVESKSFRDGDEEDIAEAAAEGLRKYLREAKAPEEEADEDS
jgi:hypothetical protein